MRNDEIKVQSLNLTDRFNQDAQASLNLLKERGNQFSIVIKIK